MNDALAYFLDLRVRVRGKPSAVALVDRCIRMISDAAVADEAGLALLEQELDVLRLELEARFGPREAVVWH